MLHQVLHGLTLFQPPKWSSCSPLCNPESVTYFTMFVIVDHVPDSNVYICRTGCCWWCSVPSHSLLFANPWTVALQTPLSSTLLWLYGPLLAKWYLCLFRIWYNTKTDFLTLFHLMDSEFYRMSGIKYSLIKELPVWSVEWEQIYDCSKEGHCT